ncbi:hypothetical protein CDN99_07985 [Roseateles aquatilis]|uniref:EAL domain-containing protein n=1 Tax=Roseateles aquatilis TaxID=431061 RepID=A0A246JI65_9BURK|nr:EAL domain-containing protein [Roseateles aquatilis]OWQ92265.1 hypothetical protein CDN99_07985 [Roseateles aquatilis]
MTHVDTIPLAPLTVPTKTGSRSASRSRFTPLRAVPGLPPVRPGDAGAVRFGSQDITDAEGRVVAHDLLFRWNTATQPDSLAPGEFLASAMLCNGLLDAAVAGRTPEGLLFIALDEPTLMSPLAELVAEQFGVVDLTDAVAIDTPVLMRVAQLRASGRRFCIDGVRDVADPRWLLAPYADYLKLDLVMARPEHWAPLVNQAMRCGLEVIGKRVESVSSHQRLSELGVTRFQGHFIAPPIDVSVPALPGCDSAVVLKAQRLLADRASVNAVAIAVSADPALVMRLLVLHRLYAAPTSQEPASLAALLAALPVSLLSGWVRALLQAACHDQGAAWVRSVRAQLARYRQSLGRGTASPGEELESAAWQFQRRLCSPRHYVKTLRHSS